MQIQKNIKQFLQSIYPIWLSAFILLCINFSPLLFNFVWGNHDWLPLLKDNQLSYGFIEGRISQYILPMFFLMGKILPILNFILGFIFYSLALVILCLFFFKFKTSKLTTALIICTTVTYPYITELIYFQFISFSLLSWPLFISISLLFAKQATLKHPIINTCLSLVFLYFSLSGYPASANLYVTGTACLFLQKKEPFNRLLKKFIPFASSLILSGLLLKLTFSYLQNEHLMMIMYNNNISSPLTLLQKIPEVLQNALISFIRPQPFFCLPLKIATSLITLIFIINYLKSSSSTSETVRNLSFILLTLIGLKFSAWLVQADPNNIFTREDPTYHILRIDFYSFPIFFAFCSFYLIEKKSLLLKNIVILLSIGLLWMNALQNLTFSKTHLLGFTAENKLLSRISNRIDTHPNFNPQTYHTVIQAGELPLRTRYYPNKYSYKSGYYTLEVPYGRPWVAFEYYNFFAPLDYVKEGNRVNPESITPTMQDFLTHEIRSWPSANALYIDNNYIIFALTPQGKDMLTTQFNLLNGY